MQLEFYTADVFTEKQFNGAQIAVVPDAGELSDEQMQLIAREFNLSETVFASPANNSDNAFSLRIFTPLGEVRFAGHAIVAVAYVLAATNRIEVGGHGAAFGFELQDNQVSVHVKQESSERYMVQFAMDAKSQIDEYVPSKEELADSLTLKIDDLESSKYRVLLSAADRNYLIVPAASYAAVRNAVFDRKAWSRTSAPSMMAHQILLFSVNSKTSHADFHARLLGPDIGIQEDPPIGASIPAFVSYLCAHKHLALGTHTFVAERGTTASRQSLLSVEMDHRRAGATAVRIGGNAVMVSSGSMKLAT
jgi:trans-2,3-dihydro-3-hydroxyanthranilate isomerase